MFQHNKRLDLDREDIHNGLEDILERAREQNILCFDHINKGTGVHDKVAIQHAEIRDAYLNAYYLLTGIDVDYGDL